MFIYFSRIYLTISYTVMNYYIIKIIIIPT